jgi:hypothetical protein
MAQREFDLAKERGIAAHHCACIGDHGGPQQNAFGRKGARPSGPNPEFEARGDK